MASDAAHAYFGEHCVVMAAGAGLSNKEALEGTWVAANVQCIYALKIISVASQHAHDTPTRLTFLEGTVVFNAYPVHRSVDRIEID